jgi:hypothetical protein
MKVDNPRSLWRYNIPSIETARSKKQGNLAFHHSTTSKMSLSHQFLYRHIVSSFEKTLFLSQSSLDKTKLCKCRLDNHERTRFSSLKNVLYLFLLLNSNKWKETNKTQNLYLPFLIMFLFTLLDHFKEQKWFTSPSSIVLWPVVLWDARILV